MYNFFTSWNNSSTAIKDIEIHLDLLQEMIKDGLVYLEDNSLTVPVNARLFVRDICMAFDKKLIHKKVKEKLFSINI